MTTQEQKQANTWLYRIGWVLFFWGCLAVSQQCSNNQAASPNYNHCTTQGVCY